MLTRSFSPIRCREERKPKRIKVGRNRRKILVMRKEFLLSIIRSFLFHGSLLESDRETIYWAYRSAYGKIRRRKFDRRLDFLIPEAASDDTGNRRTNVAVA